MRIIDDTSDKIRIENLQLENFSQEKFVCMYIYILRDMQNLKIMQ